MRFIYYLLFICLIFKQSHSVEKYEKFIDKKELVKHFTIEEIENIKIPKEWKLIKDIKYYDEVIKDYYAKLGSPKIVRDLHMTNGDNLCFEHLKKFDSIKYKTSTEFFTEGTYLDWDSCIMYTKYRQFKGNPQKKIPDRNTDLLKNYLLYYSSTDSFILQQDSNHYSYYSTLSMLAQMYAIEKPYLGFTKNEIEMVEDWFIKRASVGFADSKHSFIRGNCKFPLEYDEKEINRTAKLNAKKIPLYEVKTKSKYRGVDECGSLGTRHAFTRLLIGLLANNQTLFDKGIIDLKYLLTFIDSNGVFMPYAARGGLAISYSANILNDISVFAEIFHSLGINFYEISIPAGIKIKDVMNFHYTIWDDVVPEELIRYAKLNFGNKTHDWTELLKPKHERKKGRLGVYLPGVKEAHIKMSIRYVQEYRKDIYKNFIEEEDYGQNFFGANRALNLHAILRANERYEANVIRVQKEKEIVALNKKRLKKNAERLMKEKKLQKEEQNKRYENLLSLIKYQKQNNHYLLPKTDLIFNQTQNPIFNVKREFELKSARIRGSIRLSGEPLKDINPDLSNILIHFDRLDIKLALLQADDIKAVGYFISDPPFKKILYEVNEKIFNKCGKLLKNKNWLVIVTEINSSNDKVIKQQKCIRNTYLEQAEEVQLLYKIFLKSSPSIKDYLTSILN